MCWYNPTGRISTRLWTVVHRLLKSTYFMRRYYPDTGMFAYWMSCTHTTAESISRPVWLLDSVQNILRFDKEGWDLHPFPFLADDIHLF
jgi:hypothetical protein